VIPILAALLLVLNPGERTLIDRIVAVINGEIITLSELNTAASAFVDDQRSEANRDALMKDVLDQLIAERLIAQQIKSASVQVTDDEVSRGIEDILKQNNIDDQQLQMALKQRGMSMSQYREDVRSQLVRLKLINLKVRSRVVIPNADVRAEYEKRMQDEKREEIVTISHVYLPYPDGGDKDAVRARAEQVRKRLEQGEDFATVANEVSDGPTKETGGLLGELAMSDLRPELAQAVRKMEVGSISPLVDTAQGVHILHLSDRKTKAPVPFEEAEGKIRQDLMGKEVDRQMKVWIDELRAESAITIRLEEPTS
jgi:peptidyl-prolyl cis-trans isomerase SurA